MNKTRITAAILCVASYAGVSYGQSKADLDNRLASATTVVNEIMHTPDGGIPMAIAEKQHIPASSPA